MISPEHVAPLKPKDTDLSKTLTDVEQPTEGVEGHEENESPQQPREVAVTPEPGPAIEDVSIYRQTKVDVTIQFNVIIFSEPETEAFVCGEIEQLGSWDLSEAPRMRRIAPQKFKAGYARVPAIYSVDVAMPHETFTESGFQFKFIRKENNAMAWEQGVQTKSGNRSISYDPEKASRPVNDHLHFALILGPQNQIQSSEDCQVYAMSPAQFNVSTEVTESMQTTTYYRTVKGKNDMDYHLINEHIILGSSPRTPEHLQHLKDLGVHTIVNLQTEEDILQNGPCHANGPELNTITNYRAAIKEAGLQLIWQPTTDMCTEGRSEMVATAAWLMAGALEEHRHETKNLLYVHCNAGVGRSTAATMAYLCYLRSMSPEEAHLAVSSIRPVVFFDKEAILRGKEQFDQMYGRAIASLKIFN